MRIQGLFVVFVVCCICCICCIFCIFIIIKSLVVGLGDFLATRSTGASPESLSLQTLQTRNEFNDGTG